MWDTLPSGIVSYRTQACERIGASSVEEAITLAADIIAQTEPMVRKGPVRKHKAERELSEQAIAVLRARNEGLNYAQITDQRGISTPTSGHHPRRTREILGVETFDDAVAAVAVTPDGKQAVSASRDQTLKVWDLDTGLERRTLSGHTSAVYAVAVTPDGKQAVSASFDNTLKVWDLESGHCLCTFTADGGMCACAVAPDGVTVVAGDVAGRVHFLRLVGVAPGPPVCAARLSLGGDTTAFGCLHCRVWSEVPASALGTEMRCPNCGKAVKLNPFVIEAGWRPIAAAWRGAQED